MTFEEYDKQMKEFISELENENLNFGKWKEKVGKFQEKYMTSVLENYNADTPAKEVICDLLSYAVNISQSGSSIRDVYSEELANEIDNIIWEEIGDYLLDYEIYKEDDHWVIDCMFAGNYVPYWDGWDEL